MGTEITTASSSGLRWDILPKAITLVVSLSALGYFIGWRQTQAYYSAIGATWAASSVPPLTLLQLSGHTITVIVMAAFLSLVMLNDNHVTTRFLSWACLVLLILSALFLALSQGMFAKFSVGSAHVFAVAGSALCAITAGLTLTELYGHMRGFVSKLSSGHLWLIYWFVLPGLYWAPDRLGDARAMRDMDITASALPVVSIDPSQGAGIWRLVQLFGDKALLVQLSGKESERLFKLTDVKDIKHIGLDHLGRSR